MILKCETVQSTNHFVYFLFLNHPRAKITQTKEGADAEQRGQAAPDSLHRGAAPPVKNWIPGQPVPDRAAEAEPSPGTLPQRVSDQNLVSEQTGQNQENFWGEKLSGAASYGAGTVQPLHGKGPKVGQRIVEIREGGFWTMQ